MINNSADYWCTLCHNNNEDKKVPIGRCQLKTAAQLAEFYDGCVGQAKYTEHGDVLMYLLN